MVREEALEFILFLSEIKAAMNNIIVSSDKNYEIIYKQTKNDTLKALLDNIDDVIRELDNQHL